MFRREKKAVFLLFSSSYLTPRSWALELDWGSHLSSKVEAPWSAPTGKCSQEKKGGLPFYLLGLFDPEGLGAGTRRTLVPQEVTHLPFQSNHC
ncbi:hypothetical protein FZC80_04585 [Rossellomorea aquimaris]|uniref:Uncharacterized protein n=1 Tax=Rossellomorea aquimaris TaxID=189382 RepID=A0A5D4U6W1_9BACI|nr:hypothetical protein FZC80_04585 [Rossellomorea aquimaris]